MPVKVVQLPKIGKVILSQNIRSTRLKLSVRAGQKVLVSFPVHVPFSDAIAFAEKHASWIEEQQKKTKSVLPSFGSGVPVRTRYHTITLFSQGDKFQVSHRKFEVDIICPAHLPADDPSVVALFDKVLAEVFRWEARVYLPPRLDHFAREHGLSYKQISIRNNISNWGSCSGRNHISLNLQLMKLPDHLIDFILLHELAHTREKNHGPAFWKLLNSLCGGKAKRLTNELKKFSPGSNH